jgi:integral membrane protein
VTVPDEGAIPDPGATAPASAPMSGSPAAGSGTPAPAPGGPPAPAGPGTAPPKDPLHGALLRYRVMTYIVGSALIILVFVGVPLQVWGHVDLVAKVEGTIHGYLYLVYLFTAADLARRARWRIGRILAVVLSGFVPFLAFIVEHRVVVQMRAERAEELAALGYGPPTGQGPAPAEDGDRTPTPG